MSVLERYVREFKIIESLLEKYRIEVRKDASEQIFRRLEEIRSEHAEIYTSLENEIANHSKRRRKRDRLERRLKRCTKELHQLESTSHLDLVDAKCAFKCVAFLLPYLTTVCRHFNQYIRDKRTTLGDELAIGEYIADRCNIMLSQFYTTKRMVMVSWTGTDRKAYHRKFEYSSPHSNSLYKIRVVVENWNRKIV